MPTGTTDTPGAERLNRTSPILRWVITVIVVAVVFIAVAVVGGHLGPFSQKTGRPATVATYPPELMDKICRQYREACSSDAADAQQQGVLLPQSDANAVDSADNQSAGDR